MCSPSAGAGRRSAPGVADEPRHDVVHRQAAGLRVRHLDQDLALGDIGMRREIGLVADRPDRDLGRLEERQRLGLACARR